jgi:hypothetical protein
MDSCSVVSIDYSSGLSSDSTQDLIESFDMYPYEDFSPLGIQIRVCPPVESIL